MATRKKAGKRQKTRKSSAKPARKRARPPAKSARKRPAARRKSAAKPKGAAPRKKPAASKRGATRTGSGTAPRKTRERPPRFIDRDEERSADYSTFPPPSDRGLGLESGGQSGDTEGLSRAEEAASESVEELLEEGQAFEAGIVSGVENAADADVSEVITREVPEDDVPQEYLDEP
jgi:hypothetical protein